MKKNIFILMSVILSLALIIFIIQGCKAGVAKTTAEETTTETGTAGESKKIGITVECTNGFYMKKFIERFKEQIENHGFDYVLLDCEFDVAKQVSQIDNLIAQKVDILFVMAADPNAPIAGIKKAYEAGIPVVVVHDKIEPSGNKYTIGFAGANINFLGEQAGELMNEALNGEGNIVVLGGSFGAVYGNGIYNGFKEKLSEGIKILGEGDHGWDRTKSMNLMENFLTKYDNIDGTFSFDDNTALGVIDAIKAVNREGIKVVSINGQKEAFDAIRAGDLYGTVKMDPVANVDKAFESLDLYLSGKEAPEYNYSDSPKVTIENVDSLEPSF